METNTDCLDAKIYGEVLADCIQTVSTPITVGIHSSWGYGKTYLLKFIRDRVVERDQRSNNKGTGPKTPSIVYVAKAIGAIVLIGTFVDLMGTVISNQVPGFPAGFDSFLSGMLIGFACVVGAVVFIYITKGLVGVNEPLPSVAGLWESSFPQRAKMLAFAFFSEIPWATKEGKREDEQRLRRHQLSRRKFVVVNFSASDCLESDKLWAGMISKIFKQIESHFGGWVYRMFRSVQMEVYKVSPSELTYTKPSFLRHVYAHPSTFMNVPVWLIWVWSLLCPAFLLATMFVGLETHTIIAIVTVGYPPFAKTLKSASSMYNSGEKRLANCFPKNDKDFSGNISMMDKVKIEMSMIEKFLLLANFALNKDYKILVTVDDLDRIPFSKVKPVLDTIQILLSTPGSSYVCLIAVDTRVAVKSVEGEFGKTMLRANMNGFEYLEKIINVPFCIPRICQKKKMLLAQQFSEEPSVGLPTFRLQGQPIGGEAFSSLCLKLLLNKDSPVLVKPNPRALRRLVNVIKLSCKIVDKIMDDAKLQNPGIVVNDIRTQGFANMLVSLTVLCHLWPYRFSLILHEIEQLGLENVKENTLGQIYEYYVMDKLERLHSQSDEDPSVLALDGNLNLLHNFLTRMNTVIKISDIDWLLPFIINIDSSLGSKVMLDREVVSIKSKSWESDVKTVQHVFGDIPLLKSAARS